MGLIRQTASNPRSNRYSESVGGGSNGWAGVVVNGVIRDRAEIDLMDIGVKALGTIPRRADLGPGGELDVPFHFDGITFTPGVRLVADAGGLIVLPHCLTEANISVDAGLAATAAYAAGPPREHAWIDTPGVTGRWRKSIFMRLGGRFVFQRSAGMQ
jgi:hypothetical protein